MSNATAPPQLVDSEYPYVMVPWRKDDSRKGSVNQVVALRQPPPGLIVHSDRDSLYASQAFRKRMKDRHFRQSMSRKGNCYDNTPMESFFKSSKVEEVYHDEYETRKHAVRAATDHIERLYNRKRCMRR